MAYATLRIMDTTPTRNRTWRRRFGQYLGPLLFYRIGHVLHGIGLSPLGAIPRFLGVLLFSCDINQRARLGKRVSLPHFGIGTVVGKYAEMGDECVLMPGVLIGATLRSQAMPKLGNGVVVGAGAKLLGGIHVGDGAVIGANAVVMSDVPAYALVAGNPAVIAKKNVQPDELDV